MSKDSSILKLLLSLMDTSSYVSKLHSLVKQEPITNCYMGHIGAAARDLYNLQLYLYSVAVRIIL